MTLTRHPLLTLLLCLLAAAMAILAFETIVRVHDAFADGPALDAGVLDAAPAAATAPAKLDPASLPDPVTKPGEALGELDRARKTGTLWVPILLGLIMAGRSYVARMAPGPGEPAKGWRLKSVAVASASVVVLATVVDKLVGVGTWTAVIVASGFGLFAVIDAFNPPKGSAKSAA